MPLGLKFAAASFKRRFTTQLKNISAAKAEHAAESISRAWSDLKVAVDRHIQARSLTYDWAGVMLFTFVEAYLEDGFVLIARKDPRLLWSADPLQPADLLTPKRIFEALSIEELKTELMEQWANKMIKGGPRKWIVRLKALGARGYKKDSGDRLQHLWNTRNLIVHRQGIASLDYVRLYPHFKLKTGDRVRVGGDTLKSWFPDVRDFVHHTDKFLSRYPDQGSSV